MDLENLDDNKIQGIERSLERTFGNLKELKELREIAATRYYRLEGKEPLIDFDNADPGFLPFPPAIDVTRHAMDTKRDIIRQYTGANNTYQLGSTLYNPDMLIQYIEHIGLKPPPLPPEAPAEAEVKWRSENITPGIGATHLFTEAINSMTQPGNVVLATAPTYGIFGYQAISKMTELRTVPLSVEDGWQINPEKLDETITTIKAEGKTVRAFYHMNPHNPLGTIAGQEQVEAIAAILKKHDVFVIDDLVYSGLELGNNKAVPMASIDGMSERTLTTFSLSKAYGAPGLRSAMAVGPMDVISGMTNKMFMAFEAPPITSPLGLIGTFSMIPQIAEQRDKYLSDNAAEYGKRRNIVDGLVNGFTGTAQETQHELGKIIADLSKHKGFYAGGPAYELFEKGITGVTTLNKPEAGYFQVLDFSEYKGKFYGEQQIETSMDLAKAIAEQSGVVFLPGELMEFEGEQMLGRITYAFPPEKILDGLTRMSKALEMIQDKPYELERPEHPKIGK